jgi:hypothetical protein
MRDIIYNILVKYYGRMYGYSMCDAMTEFIANNINNGKFKTRGDVADYIWANTSGGGVAEMSSSDIQSAFPHLIQDTADLTW